MNPFKISNNEFQTLFSYLPVNQQVSSPNRGLKLEHFGARNSTTRVKREIRDGKLYPKVVNTRYLFSFEGCPLW